MAKVKGKNSRRMWLVVVATRSNMFPKNREFRDVIGPYKHKWWANFVSWLHRGNRCGCTVQSWVTESLE